MKTASVTPARAMITILLLAMFLPLASQEVALDLEMVYKIRQEGQRNSDIETLSYIMTDLDRKSVV